jgi:hypothetical protein
MTMTTVTTTTTTTTATVTEAAPGTRTVAGDSVNVIMVTSEGGADVLETGGDLAIDVLLGSTP